MILTGSQIAEEIANGEITIEPYSESRLNPNSYNYTISRTLFEVKSDDANSGKVTLDELAPRAGRWLLRKGSLYLSTTNEIIGSKSYVVSLIGRSSIGRLGLFLQVTANIGHQGSLHRWTLELFACHDVYIYPGQTIGQVSFWRPTGETANYVGRYGHSDTALISHLHWRET